MSAPRNPGIVSLNSFNRRPSTPRNNMGERRESVGRLRAASVSSKEEQPPTRMVSVAVLPPRLPSGMAPPTGVGMADAFSWDEAINYQHDDPIQQEEPGRRKSFMRKIGLTTQRKRAAAEDDLPPFIMRQVPYDVWRKHYAKDKDGNYHGTHAPAEDCLLKPDDVRKWRLGEPVTQGDKWTRGREALPVYAEVKAEGSAPDYDANRTGLDPNQTVPMMTSDEEALASQLEREDTMGSTSSQAIAPDDRSDGALFSRGDTNEPGRPTIADGKTAQEIIEEAKAKQKPKMTWREKLKKGTEMVMAGN